MTFLAPTLGIIAGALGALGVLASYFLKLRRRPVRIASTLLWERAVQDLQVNAPFRWLRASWLLLLQLLIVACVALALARPAIEGEGLRTDRVIFVIDRSASMSATDAAADRTRFEAARGRALDRLDALDRSAQVMIIGAGAGAETVLGFTRDHGAARQALRAIEPTDQPGDLARVMRVVGAFAQVGGDDESAREEPPGIYLFTDGGDAPPGGLGVPVPSDRVLLERVGPEPGVGAENAGVVALSARRDFDDPSLVRLFARVVSARREPSEVLVRLEMDGTPIDSQRVRVPGFDERQQPGEAPLTFELRDADGAVATLSIVGNDVLSSDDVAAVVLRPPTRPRVVIVEPDAGLTWIEQTIVDAIESYEPASVERLSATAYEEAARDGALLARTDMLVFYAVRPSELPPIPSLSFEAGLPIPGLLFDGADRAPTRIAFWSRSHPTMRELTLSSIVINAAGRLAAPESDDVERDILITGARGPLALAIESAGIRRVVVGFGLRDSTWSAYDSLPVFVANCMEWLTLAGVSAGAVSTTTATPATILEPALSPGSEVTLSGPRGIERTGVVEPSGRVVFGVLPSVGLYSARQGDLERAVAVNLSSEHETALRTSDTPLVAGAGATLAAGAGSATLVEIWRWFVLAAAGLLAIEWALYAWKMRL